MLAPKNSGIPKQFSRLPRLVKNKKSWNKQQPRAERRIPLHKSDIYILNVLTGGSADAVAISHVDLSISLDLPHIQYSHQLFT